MAAYAALVTLMNLTEDIQIHPRLLISLDKYLIESLRERVCFLLDFIESYNPHGGSKEAEDLESQIASAAHAAEDVIESHIVDQIHAGSTGKSHGCLLDLRKVIEGMDSIKEKVMEVMEKGGFKEVQPTYSRPATSSRTLTTGKNGMVGFDDELIQLIDVLTGQPSSRQIISIVGMGGIGKTTLARNVYENLFIVHHFDVRLWATISQDYSVGQILLELLFGDRSSTKIGRETDYELGEKLHKRLSGRRYLIVLDDMWSIEAWNNIKFFVPDNYNRSRIVVTTRQSDVANHFGSSCLAMNFLDEEKSWNLFCEKAFSEQGCPPDLEETGKKIAKKCKGLPISIVVIGGHLGKSSRTKEYWENVGNDVNSILDTGEDKQWFEILSLSYSYLPAYLKPCFLYMGIFPEDREICVSRLIKLWVAEGFLKPSKHQSLEEVAEDCLKDLVDRNLTIVHKWSGNGKIKTCNIHDLLRELCLKVAMKEKFFYVVKSHDLPQPMNRERRVVIHGRIPEEKYHAGVFHALKSAALLRSLICKGGQLLFDYRLLKVLNAVEGVVNVADGGFLEAKFEQVNLRYLDWEFFRLLCAWIFCLPQPVLSVYLPKSISSIWNLQTIIIRGQPGHFVAPSEIWEMPQLRHVEINPICLPDPPPSDQQKDFLVLGNLHTLSNVNNLRLSEEFCKRIPNIKKLHLCYSDFPRECEASSYCCQRNFGHFHKLESLKCTFTEEPNWHDFVLNFKFPSSLQKLSLRNCFLHWKDLTMIGSLPHLEVLKLDWKSVIGSEWNPVEGEFLRLKFLKIYACNDLIHWNADRSHFPVLENLVLERLNNLDEIPSGIGEIPTLRFIRLEYCSMSAAISAMRILVEQEELGNQGLQLEVEFWGEEELESFRKMLELEGLTSNNLRLNH